MTAERASPNREQLLLTARRLGPLLTELVFVGGQIAELLITDPAAVRVRPTDDVDVIVPTTTRRGYREIEETLKTLGFVPDTRVGAPICRFRTRDDLILDVMPLDPSVLGFSNQWYPYAIKSSEEVELEPGLIIRIAGAAAFLATKWEAYNARGAGDPIGSHDVEDIVAVIAGRRTIVAEVERSTAKARHFIADHTGSFLAGPWAIEAIEGALPDARYVRGLLDVVLERFRQLGAMR